MSIDTREKRAVIIPFSQHFFYGRDDDERAKNKHLLYQQIKAKVEAAADRDGLTAPELVDAKFVDPRNYHYTDTGEPIWPFGDADPRDKRLQYVQVEYTADAAT